MNDFINLTANADVCVRYTRVLYERKDRFGSVEDCIEILRIRVVYIINISLLCTTENGKKLMARE